MPQSLAKIYIHIVFGTKNRIPFIQDMIEKELYAYIAGVLRRIDSPAMKIGGYFDHIHILCLLSRKYAISKVVEEVKKSSSKWIKTKNRDLHMFRWQNGYGAFSVSQSLLEQLEMYISNQKKHHRSKTFQDELRDLLQSYRVAFNEQYLWD